MCSVQYNVRHLHTHIHALYTYMALLTQIQQCPVCYRQRENSWTLTYSAVWAIHTSKDLDRHCSYVTDRSTMLVTVSVFSEAKGSFIVNKPGLLYIRLHTCTQKVHTSDLLSLCRLLVHILHTQSISAAQCSTCHVLRWVVGSWTDWGEHDWFKEGWYEVNVWQTHTILWHSLVFWLAGWFTKGILSTVNTEESARSSCKWLCFQISNRGIRRNWVTQLVHKDLMLV